MELDKNGIRNVNEFYSDHYFETLFDDDVKKVVSDLSDDIKGQTEAGTAETDDTKKSRTPQQNLRALANSYSKRVGDFREAEDSSVSLAIFREFSYEFLSILGYERKLEKEEFESNVSINLLHRATRADENDVLWIVESISDPKGEIDTNLLEVNYQYPTDESNSESLDSKILEDYTTLDVLNKDIFGSEQPPRFILFLSMAQAVLIDRNKWHSNRCLCFDFSTIFSTKDQTTFSAVVALLHQQSLVPKTGVPQIDKFDSASLNHAHGVSKDLKYALRESIELLGNEAAEQIIQQKKKSHETIYKTRDGEIATDPDQISNECLRFMYRLLFLFFIESRPNLGFVPIKSVIYRKGYSLESLRELELINLTTEDEKNGYYFHDSITLLFKLVFKGTFYSKFEKETSTSTAFEMLPVRAELFDEKSLPLLSKVRFRNETLQHVIRLMSITQEGKKQRGRISYAQLGISQLGAVYEGLLSYSGFFAQEDLYEVKKAGDPNPDILDVAYFVGKSEIDNYLDDEIIRDDGEPRCHKKGTFLYRLAGRNRENSASYYTPEILTKCLVKYSLKELLRPLKGKPDKILELTVCEPAMGSAAFLVETVNQLADAYLEEKQIEKGERIPHDEFELERQKVRAYITDRNIFGVDRNPIAKELGQVSLWLNCIHKDNDGTQFVPWFGDQLFSGNSLIGGRREVYKVSRISTKTNRDDRWFKHAPRPITSDKPREEDEVYHFLLPDQNMSVYKETIIGPLLPENLQIINNWRNEFTKPLSEREIDDALHLSSIIDKLFEENAQELARERHENIDTISIWGQAQKDKKTSGYDEKNERLAETKGKGAKNSVPYQRLKMALDYWCSLWFWPINDVESLPTRDEFYMEMILILEGNLLNSGADLFKKAELSDDNDPERKELFKNLREVGYVEFEHLQAKVPRTKMVAEIAYRHRFFHWPVELADIIVGRGGFDLIVGNPPWMVQEMSDKGILSEFDPNVAIKGLSAAQIESKKPEILNSEFRKVRYLHFYEEIDLARSFMSSCQNFSLVVGKANLYKCFIEKIFKLMLPEGISGIIHPDGHFMDPKSGGELRKASYQRLIYHFQFRNEFSKLMFSDINSRAVYSINVYRGSEATVNFKNINNILLPVTVDECFLHDGQGSIPNIKNENGDWQIQGHIDRVLTINDEILKVFSILLGTNESSQFNVTRMPSPFSNRELSFLAMISTNNPKFGNSINHYHMDSMWNETNDIKKTKVMKRNTRFHDDPSNMIISGPNFFVANPLAKTPRENCKSKGDYDSLDLSFIPDDYLPRANYEPNVENQEYFSKISHVRWSNNSKHTDFFRCFFRAMTNSQNERTLICSIQPSGIAHPHSIESVSFQNEIDLLNAVGLWSSLPLDFIAKSTEYVSIFESFLITLPWTKLPPAALQRVLQLNCLTTWYTPLWDNCIEAIVNEDWSDNRLSLTKEGPNHATKNWSRYCGLRMDFSRRQALLEIDVLVAISLGLQLDDLIQMYQVQFPVMQSYDRNTWYDQNGRIVFTNSMNLSGVGLDRKTWESVKDQTEGTVNKQFTDNTTPEGPIERTIEYQAPFVLPNRIEDYKRAWDYFYPKYSSYAER